MFNFIESLEICQGQNVNISLYQGYLIKCLLKTQCAHKSLVKFYLSSLFFSSEIRIDCRVWTKTEFANGQNCMYLYAYVVFSYHPIKHDLYHKGTPPIYHRDENEIQTINVAWISLRNFTAKTFMSNKDIFCRPHTPPSSWSTPATRLRSLCPPSKPPSAPTMIPWCIYVVLS